MDIQREIESLEDIYDVAEVRIKNGDNCGVVYIPPDKLTDFKAAISAMQELRQYRKIGTLEECQKYKNYNKNISKLNDCNDCGRRKDCKIVPEPGEYCRINCAWWRKQGWGPAQEDNNENWKNEARIQAAAAGQMKIELAIRLDALKMREQSISSLITTASSDMDKVTLNWKLQQYQEQRKWLEELLYGKQDHEESQTDH